MRQTQMIRIACEGCMSEAILFCQRRLIGSITGYHFSGTAYHRQASAHVRPASNNRHSLATDRVPDSVRDRVRVCVTACVYA